MAMVLVAPGWMEDFSVRGEFENEAILNFLKWLTEQCTHFFQPAINDFQKVLTFPNSETMAAKYAHPFLTRDLWFRVLLLYLSKSSPLDVKTVPRF